MQATDLLSALRDDHDRVRGELPLPVEAYILDRYGFSLASSYGGLPIRNPFGKASGQLSLNPTQIQNDADAGLGFVVLKTVIAEDAQGLQSMRAWAVPEAHMKVERITANRADASETDGWTVTWKGRGWSGSLEDYLMFFDRSIEIGLQHNTLVVPSCKYHLPQPGEHEWHVGEYQHTTQALLETWRRQSAGPMPIEKDFSPTLAGDTQYSRVEAQILYWLREVPKLMRSAVAAGELRVGLKLFNAQFDDAFQLEMLETVSGAAPELRPDYIVYCNRLYDPSKEFESTLGAAYGGPDLSARNLATLRKWNNRSLPFSATGNIITGQKAFEYLQRGATSFQMHTLFQLPDNEYAMTTGTRTERGLHRLLFHPEHGFIRSVVAWMNLTETPSGKTIEEIAALMSR